MRQSTAQRQLLAPSCRTRTSVGICLDLLGSACCCFASASLSHEPLPTGALTHHSETHEQKRDPSGTRSSPGHWLSPRDNREDGQPHGVLECVVGTKNAGMPMIIEANSGAHQPQVFTELRLILLFFNLPNSSPGASPGYLCYVHTVMTPACG